MFRFIAYRSQIYITSSVFSIKNTKIIDFQGLFSPSISYSDSRRQNVDSKIRKKAFFFICF